MNYQLYKAQRSLPTRQKKEGRWRGWLLSVKIVLLLTVGLCSTLATLLWQGWRLPLVSPLSDQTRFAFLPYQLKPAEKEAKKLIYGFAPYWNLARVKLNPPLTQFAYFALSLGADGNLLTTGDAESRNGYLHLQSSELADLLAEASEKDIEAELVIKQFNPEAVRSFLQSPQAQANFFTQLDSLLLAYPFTGINLDIELLEGARALQPDFTRFVAALGSHLAQRKNKINLSISLYPSAASGENIWNLTELNPVVDHFIVMAYDYHRRQSAQAGPISPLLGGEVYQNINQHLKSLLELTPSHKILLGIPFYGYEWQTTSRNEQALTYPETGATASYERVRSILAQKDALRVEEHWNERALSPYLSYEKEGNTYLLYYENPRSLTYKLDYVRQLHLGGIAIWALGYEGEADDLWAVIETLAPSADTPS